MPTKTGLSGFGPHSCSSTPHSLAFSGEAHQYEGPQVHFDRDRILSSSFWHKNYFQTKVSLTKWGVEKATRALLVPTNAGLSGFGLQNSLQVALWGWRQGTERARQSSQDAGIDIIHITGGLHKSRHCWRVPIRRWHGSEIFSQAWHVYGTRSSGHYRLGLSESKSKTRIDLGSIIKPFLQFLKSTVLGALFSHIEMLLTFEAELIAGLTVDWATTWAS